MKRGALIVIEGMDGSGKATQKKLLIDRLKSEGIPAESMSFPRYETPTGRIVGQCYLGKTLGEGDKAWFGDATKIDPLVSSLYYAADRRAAASEMNAILDSGTNLILDRYYQSNMAHQGSKIEDYGERNNFFDKIMKLELHLLGIPKEDKMILLYMPWQVSWELLKNRKELDGLENPEHLMKAERAYHDLKNSSLEPETIYCSPIVDENEPLKYLKSPEDIAEEVYEITKRVIERKLKEN